MKAPRTVLSVSALSFSTVILAGGWLAMAKPPNGGGKPIDLPATLTFRDDTSDRILSDGDSYVDGDEGIDGGVLNVRIRNDGELFFNLNGRELFLDFSDRVDMPGESPSLGDFAIAGPNPGAAGRVVAMDEFGEKLSLLELPAFDDTDPQSISDTTFLGRMRFGWWTTKNEPRYGLRFQLPTGNDDVIDDLIMQESTEVVITRAGAPDGNPINTWFIEAVAPFDAGVLYRAEGKGKGVRTYEGTYLMPFCMKVEEALN